MTRLTTILWLVTASMMLAVTGAASADASAEAKSPAYQLQAGDVLAVSVWNEPALQSDVLVRLDDAVSFPLTGDISTRGMTVDDLRLEIAKRLQKFVPDPAVTVALKQSGGNRIYVLGKVNRPGEFEFNKALDVMQAISMAGGTTPYAAVDDIRILRRKPNGQQDAIRFRYSEVARGESLGQNILLASGDTVVVP